MFIESGKNKVGARTMLDYAAQYRRDFSSGVPSYLIIPAAARQVEDLKNHKARLIAGNSDFIDEYETAIEHITAFLEEFGFRID
jgi:hypothetical protein